MELELDITGPVVFVRKRVFFASPCQHLVSASECDIMICFSLLNHSVLTSSRGAERSKQFKRGGDPHVLLAGCSYVKRLAAGQCQTYSYRLAFDLREHIPFTTDLNPPASADQHDSE